MSPFTHLLNKNYLSTYCVPGTVLRIRAYGNKSSYFGFSPQTDLNKVNYLKQDHIKESKMEQSIPNRLIWSATDSGPNFPGHSKMKKIRCECRAGEVGGMWGAELGKAASLEEFFFILSPSFFGIKKGFYEV